MWVCVGGICLSVCLCRPNYFSLFSGMSEEDEIPHKFYERLRNRILSKVSNTSVFGMDCWEWSGEQKIGKNTNYGMIKLSLRGDTMHIHAHRASYMAFNEQFILPHAISRLCPHRQCVNPQHLTHECSTINQERERCHESGYCFGHKWDGKVVKSCIFGKHLDIGELHLNLVFVTSDISPEE